MIKKFNSYTTSDDFIYYYANVTLKQPFGGRTYNKVLGVSENNGYTIHQSPQLIQNHVKSKCEKNFNASPNDC